MSEAGRFNPLNLEGRRYLITGAGSGIGRAIAVLVSRLGGTVACMDMNAGALDETMAALEGSGHKAVVIDLRDLAAIPAHVQAVAESLGKLHGFVHAAGIPGTLPLRVLTPEAWRETFLVNTESALALTKAFQAAKVYAGEKGSVVFISSIMGLVGDKGNVAYAMSKGALTSMTRSMALELASKAIRVNCVAPAFVRTPMYIKAEQAWSPEQKALVEGLHPLGIGEPDDVANAVAFLLADTGRWITGTTLVADGGYTAR
jgi:NAD(P)-dependent dehydrogenase (short-subunit alcohol dehydrogenase family)